MFIKSLAQIDSVTGIKLLVFFTVQNVNVIHNNIVALVARKKNLPCKFFTGLPRKGAWPPRGFTPRDKIPIFIGILFYAVDPSGFEPLTSAMPMPRSKPTELWARVPPEGIEPSFKV